MYIQELKNTLKLKRYQWFLFPLKVYYSGDNFNLLSKIYSKFER